jgi:hypothetical protein
MFKLIEKSDAIASWLQRIFGDKIFAIGTISSAVSPFWNPLTATIGLFPTIVASTGIGLVIFLGASILWDKKFQSNRAKGQSIVSPNNEPKFIETCVTYDLFSRGNSSNFTENKEKNKNVKRSIIYDKPILDNGFLCAQIVNIFDRPFPCKKIGFVKCDGHGFKDIYYKIIHTEVNEDFCVVCEVGELRIKADSIKDLKRFTIEYHEKQ